LLALRVFVSFLPAAVLLTSFLAVRAYPINRERHAELRAELKKRKSTA
jgi:Na+/melibiose symporter-like transporter